MILPLFPDRQALALLAFSRYFCYSVARVQLLFERDWVPHFFSLRFCLANLSAKLEQF
jgi:hypothetical protein